MFYHIDFGIKNEDIGYKNSYILDNNLGYFNVIAWPDPSYSTFTLSPESGASSCCADLPGDWALYAVSVRRLIALHLGFLQTQPHDCALAFG